MRICDKCKKEICLEEKYAIFSNPMYTIGFLHTRRTYCEKCALIEKLIGEEISNFLIERWFQNGELLEVK